MTWHLDAYGSPPEGVLVDRRSRWQLVLAMASLRDDMDAGVAGITWWSADDGWHIVDPADGAAISADTR